MLSSPRHTSPEAVNARWHAKTPVLLLPIFIAYYERPVLCSSSLRERMPGKHAAFVPEQVEGVVDSQYTRQRTGADTLVL